MMDYAGIGRKLLKVEEIPQGDVPIYDADRPMPARFKPTNDLDVILMDIPELAHYTFSLSELPSWHNKLCHVRNLRPDAGKKIKEYLTETHTQYKLAPAYSRWLKVFA